MRRLTEDDFSTRLQDGEDLPVIEFETGWIVSYGHIEFEEFVGWVHRYYKDMADEDPGSDIEETDVLWVWAKAKTSRYDDEWSVNWGDVTSEDEDAFPLTVLAVW